MWSVKLPAPLGHKLMGEFVVPELSLSALSKESCLKLSVGHIKYYNTSLGFAVLTSELAWLSKDSLLYLITSLCLFSWHLFIITGIHLQKHRCILYAENIQKDYI